MDSRNFRKADDVLYLNCAECDESVKAPNGSRIREHLLTHLHRTNLPFRCPAEGCLHMTGSAKVLPSHFQSKHPLLRWTDDMVCASKGCLAAFANLRRRIAKSSRTGSGWSQSLQCSANADIPRPRSYVDTPPPKDPSRVIISAIPQCPPVCIGLFVASY